MLAKVWKKALLAVCILACVINVMYKLISRTSLDVQLKSVQEQTSATNIWEDKQDEPEEENLSEEKQAEKQAEENKKEEKSSDDDTIVVIY